MSPPASSIPHWNSWSRRSGRSFSQPPAGRRYFRGASAGSVLHPPVADSVAAPTLAAPEVSRPITADTSVAAQQPTEPQGVKLPAEAPHIPRWGVWLAADVSEGKAWTLYRERARQFASLIGDREPVVLFRQLPGLALKALRHRHCRRRPGPARQILQEAQRRRQHLQRPTRSAWT